MNLFLVAIFAGVCFLIARPYFGSRRSSAPAVEAPAPVRPLTPGRHVAARIWNRNDVTQSLQGWWYECTCGQKGRATDMSNYHRGTEGGAIKAFNSHRTLRVGLEESYTAEVTNEFEEKYNQAVTDLAKYRSLCFCKDANDDLIVFTNELDNRSEPR